MAYLGQACRPAPTACLEVLDHAQLVLGLSGCLEFEVEGRGSRVLRQTFAVVPAQARHACSS
ncbi:hypothetical protein CAY91_35065, partial [Pseudomonas aeruginosa]